MPPRAWAQLLAEALDLPFHRVAQPGATTPWMAEHLLPRAQGRRYALACVHVGTNDVRSADWDVEVFAPALDRILGGLDAERICVATVPLDLGRPRAGAKVADLDSAIERVARVHHACIVDLRGMRSWREQFPDAVHPTAVGQLQIARRACAALDLDVELPAPRAGLAADARYVLGRHAGHLLRDYRRRAFEGVEHRLRRR